jgi:DNA-binding MarR family transcriptional regulator
VNAYLSEYGYGQAKSALPPILIAGDSDASLKRAAASVEAAGIRIAAQVPIEAAVERMDQQVASSALWIEIERDGGEPMDRLLGEISRDVRDGRYAAVISTTADAIDAVTARVVEPAVELIVDGDASERAAALAIALARRSAPLSLSDAASDRSAARLRQLSDEVSRIASTLARLSTGPGGQRSPAIEPAGDAPDVSIDEVRSVIRARRLRSRYFPEHLFADPAWDMLLDLMQAELAQLRVPVSSLCIAAAVPATTALRWLKSMTEEGIFVRRADPHDGRRVFVELSPQASSAMRRYFAEVGRPGVA